MKVEKLSALALHSKNPAQLAAFYQECLGITFELANHGPMRSHFEADLGGLHIAILKAAKHAAPVVPTFHVADLEAHLQFLSARAVAPLHPIIDLGQGKRVAAFRDSDLRPFRLIELAKAPPTRSSTPCVAKSNTGM